MGMFEDAVVKAKDVFDVASQKTCEVVSVQKMKICISRANAELKKEYAKLGKLCYESKKKDCDVEKQMTQVILDIDAKIDEIKELKEQLSVMKNEITCSSCGQKCTKESEFCNKCGEHL
ncbi:MAG: hypothetical protein II306_07310 [Clostridia bacterium]|nr:hypothetical protein [Clostridia bacterium]MEE1023803.1 hypothetical protein [Acutalibacteraceae bacterium]